MSEPISLESFLNHLQDAVVLADATGRVLRQNSAFRSLFPSKRQENEPLSLTELFSEQPLLLERLKKITQQGGSYFLRDLALQRSWGEERVDVEASPIMDSKGQLAGIAFFFRLDRSMGAFGDHQRRTDRLQYLATIASGMAHEIRNPLSGIKGASQLLSDSLKDREDLSEYADIIRREVDRVDRLVKDLLHFSKPRKLSKKPTNVNRVLHDLILLEKTVEPERIQIVEEYDPSLPPVRADAEALSQVFLNLIRNARQAIKGPGRIQVRSRIVMDFTLKRHEKRRQMLSVDVEDTGCGIEPEDLANIFVPFFTTKAKGTGLGLALCHQMVEEHEGDIRVKTEKGRGTTFSVYLPV